MLVHVCDRCKKVLETPKGEPEPFYHTLELKLDGVEQPSPDHIELEMELCEDCANMLRKFLAQKGFIAEAKPRRRRRKSAAAAAKTATAKGKRGRKKSATSEGKPVVVAREDGDNLRQKPARRNSSSGSNGKQEGAAATIPAPPPKPMIPAS